ncbi:MAG TPA: HD domain-containing protein [Acidimicrobiales bacterium]|nr:HD domain-containing protein [Acidimicrobiales bacterium]
MTSASTQVQFTRMQDGTSDEFQLIVRQAEAHASQHLVDNVLGMLHSMIGPTLGYRIDRYQHSLQTATRAHRDGARIDLVVAALLHDIGDVIAPANHSELAAAVLAPYVDEESTWVVRHHGVFQGYHYWDKLGLDRDSREKYRGSPWFDSAAHFCAEWDQTAFDPDYDSLPIEFFEPMVREVFARPASGFGSD